MKARSIMVLAALLGLKRESMALAKDAASVKILSPANNAQLEKHYGSVPDFSLEERSLEFTTKGTCARPGEHVITIKVVDKGHVPTGPQQSIKVTTK
jgi:hypothetical protein